ncbi:MAG: prepilin-type N-terminal cleavage/methylation domain-containing protein [Clostridia bacterium]
MKKNKGKRGFTLVELMIVIVIIGILAAIIIPTVTNAIDKAKVSADKADITSMNKELAIASLDYNVAYFNADEVRYVLSQYSLKSRQKDKIIWYDREHNKMEIGGAETLLDDSTAGAETKIYPSALEAIGKNTAWLYMDSDISKPQSKALHIIKNLITETKNDKTLTETNLFEKLTAKFNSVLNGITINRIKSILQDYSPSKTLYIGTDGFYTSQKTMIDSNFQSSFNFNNVVICDGVTTLPEGKFIAAGDADAKANEAIIRVSNTIMIPCSIVGLTKSIVDATNPTIGTFVNLSNDTKVVATVASVVIEGSINPEIIISKPSINETLRIQVLAKYKRMVSNTVGETTTTTEKIIDVSCPIDGAIIYLPKDATFYVDVTAQQNAMLKTAKFDISYITANSTTNKTAKFRITFFSTDNILIAVGEVNYIAL